MKLTETYEKFDVVKVPFPFTDKALYKRRPALVLSPAKLFNAKIGASICAMITSVKGIEMKPWPLDIYIQDLEAAGLPAPSVIRLKLFTLDHRLIIKCIGHLNIKDAENVQKNLSLLFVD